MFRAEIVLVSVRHHRFAQPVRPELAALENAGRRFLRERLRTGACMRQAVHLQQRSGGAVHEQEVHLALAAC